MSEQSGTSVPYPYQSETGYIPPSEEAAMDAMENELAAEMESEFAPPPKQVSMSPERAKLQDALNKAAETALPDTAVATADMDSILERLKSSAQESIEIIKCEMEDVQAAYDMFTNMAKSRIQHHERQIKMVTAALNAGKTEAKPVRKRTSKSKPKAAPAPKQQTEE